LGAEKENLLIDFAAHSSQVWVTHKVDVDAHEDQCISEVLVTTNVMNRGCEFRLLFRGDGIATDLQLIDARLSADSFCAGWPDEAEGAYQWLPHWNAPRLKLSRGKVPDRTADRSCVELQMSIVGELKMAASKQKTKFAINDLVIRGVFDSVGDTQAVCPAKTPPPPPPPPPKPPPKPPAPKAEDVGLSVAVGGALSLHHYIQEGVWGGGLYPFDMVFGGDVTESVKSPGVDLFVRYGAGWLAVEGSAALNYGPFAKFPEFGEPVEFATDEISLTGVMSWNQELFQPGARLGWIGQAATLFEAEGAQSPEEAAESGIFVRNQAHFFNAVAVGMEVGLGRRKGVNGRLRLDLGFSGNYHSSTSFAADLSIPISGGWSIRPYHKSRVGSYAIHRKNGDTAEQVGLIENANYRFGIAAAFSM
jgi:hypothetical protein